LASNAAEDGELFLDWLTSLQAACYQQFKSGYIRLCLGYSGIPGRNCTVICAVILLLLAATTLFHPTAFAQTSTTALSIPFENSVNGPLLYIQVDGHRYHMLLDTGSQATIFRDKIGDQGEMVKLRTAGGDTIVYSCRVSIESISIPARCGDRDLPFDGLLGEDFLRQFSAVTIDYKHQIVTFAH
jgi:hypothetical protein